MVFGNSSSAAKAAEPATIISPRRTDEIVEPPVRSEEKTQSEPAKKVVFKTTFGLRSDPDDLI
jgi:hypothetical protein